MTDWQPIETAPTDGTLVDLWVDGEHRAERRADCFWSNEGWEDQPHWRQKFAEAESDFPVEGEPTHWMPRPDPPP